MKKNTGILLGLFIVTGIFVYPALGAHPPVNPKASPEAKSVLAYLYQISGKRMLAGQYENNNQPTSDLDQVWEATGRLPAIVGDDLGWGANTDQARQVLVRKAIDRWTAKKMILTLSWHTCPVETQWEMDDCDWKDINIPGPERVIDAILTPGTTEQEMWLARMDKAAITLKALRDAHVPVFWRPFHEMNGAWFWWGKQPRLKELWVQQFERFTTFHKLDNLIWVYSPNCEMAYTQSFAENYPGHHLVDVLGMDIYTNYGHTYDKRHHDRLTDLGEGRPIAICENGLIPDPELMAKEQPNWVWFNTWTGFLPTNPEGWARSVYRNARVITQEAVELPPFDPISIHPIQGKSVARKPERSFKGSVNPYQPPFFMLGDNDPRGIDGRSFDALREGPSNP